MKCKPTFSELGITLDPRFIPWPDTQRFWKKHMNAEQAAFLDVYLPPKKRRVKKATRIEVQELCQVAQ